jgi:hypothetical protein
VVPEDEVADAELELDVEVLDELLPLLPQPASTSAPVRSAAGTNLSGLTFMGWCRVTGREGALASPRREV